jgi:hypothetical protein
MKFGHRERTFWRLQRPEPPEVLFGLDRCPYAVQVFKAGIAGWVAEPDWLTGCWRLTANWCLTQPGVVRVVVTDRKTGETVYRVDKQREPTVKAVKEMPQLKTSPTGSMVRLWVEDDAETFDRETVSQAWHRLFGENYVTESGLGQVDKGDGFDNYFSAGRLVRRMPEGFSIWAVTELWAPWLLEA